MDKDIDTLVAASNWYFEVCDLWEDEDLDPDDHLQVVQRAFMSSDCDDFAWLMSEITGFPPVRLTWTIPGHGFGHHTVVQADDGRLLDVRGWTSLDEIADYFRLKDSNQITPKTLDAAPLSGVFSPVMYDHGFQAILTVAEQLPYEPFSESDFMERLAAYRSRLQLQPSP